MENPLVEEVHTSKITRAVVWDQAEECLLEPACLHCSSKFYISSELGIGELLLFVCVCLCDLFTFSHLADALIQLLHFLKIIVGGS